ncbi:ASCH domain-containing protein [Cellulophaga baltica]|uniref:ASCH domain-containing protein n=1 Tax=Cellulophaga TaxID=104264 RepID=UPI001C06C4DA|nr:MULTISPECIES: ASCH domain-containing protein [Cellulophaga]MBU2997665.1 ASCH domain-containing protein [Cellulophaga baltica]MDO6769060.1 ASCH domain-containing protein [Cellulophaga sp. 1_MG-2023]
MENTSAQTMWDNYLDKNLKNVLVETPRTIHLSDNESEANSSVDLTLKGLKKATSNTLIALQNKNETLPKIGSYLVITDWNKNPKCIIKITAVKLKPFFAIDSDFAIKEGDKTLDSWKKTHWDYFSRELHVFKKTPNESMIIVCQEFEKVYE